MSSVLGICPNNDSIRSLHSNQSLWNYVKLYHFDLIHYGKDKLSQARLELDPERMFYMTSAYFSDKDIELLLAFPTSCGGSFESTMKSTVDRKMRAGGFVCSSHDLAPIVAEVFNIRKGYANDKLFIAFMKANKWRF